MRLESLGTMTVTMTIKIKPEISLWDALKMRLMGRRPAALILTHMLKTMKEGGG